MRRDAPRVNAGFLVCYTWAIPLPVESAAFDGVAFVITRLIASSASQVIAAQ
jgi:hypothetical protein